MIVEVNVKQSVDNNNNNNTCRTQKNCIMLCEVVIFLYSLLAFQIFFTSRVFLETV